MAQLQKPAYVFMDGRLVAWDDAKVHVGSEALLRGVSVFEGIKGYWQHDEREFSLLALKQHYERLKRSARLIQVPFEWSYEQLQAAATQLISKLVAPDKDMWMRATVVAVEGHWGENTKTDLILTAYTQPKQRPEPIDVGISTWQRPGDASQPARIKSVTNYQVSRMARIEGRRQGFSDMILLNPWGRVAEATGACLLMVRDGRVVTPPPWECCLESITADIIEALCKELSLPFERRPVDRTELLVANEACLLGTLAELVPIRSIEGAPLAGGDVLPRLADGFWGFVRGQRKLPGFELTPIVASGVART